jgi:DNA polymerase-4
MRNGYNFEQPLIMHIDLNSAFATIEQQSRPLLRGKPVAILNRRCENTSIVAASYEAKAYGIKVGTKLTEARLLCPGLVPLESDPAKYRFVYQKLMSILNDYSPKVVMKSIDEGLIDFHGVVNPRPLTEIGLEIKKRLKDEIGVAMRCNVGIGPNRFLAKVAADINKPDGMYYVDANNLRETYQKLKLTDLTGIANQFEKRLNAVGIFTPLQFLDADKITLQRIVFKSIAGAQWYERLRGYEVDDVLTKTKRVGRQYVLEDRNLSRKQIEARLHNLCESVGSRLRLQKFSARGVYVYARTIERQYWHTCRSFQIPFYSDKTINFIAQDLFKKAPEGIMEIGVHCYELTDSEGGQINLFYDELAREKRLVTAVDDINGCYGDRTIHSADTLETDNLVKSKIPFGSTRYL